MYFPSQILSHLAVMYQQHRAEWHLVALGHFPLIAGRGTLQPGSQSCAFLTLPAAGRQKLLLTQA